MTNFEKWFDENLADYSDRLSESGAINGTIPHLSLTQECVELYNQFEEDIWLILINSAKEYGYQNVLELLIDFKYDNMLDNLNDFKTMLIWLTCEKLACQKVS